MAWLDDWKYRVKCTLDGNKISADLYNFPIPVMLSSSSGRNSFDFTPAFNELSSLSGTIFSEYFTTLSGWTIVTGSGNVNNGYLDIVLGDTTIISNDIIVLDENFDISFSMKWGFSGWVWHGNIYFGYETINGKFAIGVKYLNSPGGNYFSLLTKTSVNPTTLHTYAPPGYGPGHWFNHKIRRNGTSLLWKVWRADYDEPSAWNVILKNVFSGSEEKSGFIQIVNGPNTSFNIDNIIVKKHSPLKLKKLAITDSDGTTQLPVEIEYWDQYTKQGILWTKIPTLLSGVDKNFYIYFDSSKLDNYDYVGFTGDVVATNVWDSNFVAVYHFNSNAIANLAFELKDSTANGNHLTPIGVNNDLRYSLAGQFWWFDGADDYAYRSTNSTFDLVNNYTLEAVVYPTSKHLVDEIICKATSDSNGYQLRGGNGLYSFFTGVGSVGSYPYNTNTWYYLVGTFSGVAMKFYSNGLLYSSGNASTSGTPTNSADFVIGRRWDSAYYFDGGMTEIRISNTARDADWIKATYYSLVDDLLIYSLEQVFLNICSGTVSVDSYFANNIKVRLYRRSTGELVDETTSSGMGNFILGSPYLEDHYVVALYTSSGTNALVYDFIAP